MKTDCIKAGDIINLTETGKEINPAFVLSADISGEITVCCQTQKNDNSGYIFSVQVLLNEQNTLNTELLFSLKKINTFDYTYKPVIGSVSTSMLDQILRTLSRFTADLHYSAITDNKKSSHIPVTGKVLDKADLHNMIDASLDMWLTTGRFNYEFEKELADFLGASRVITVNSGSSANLIAVTALMSHRLGKRRLKEGDEVITVAAGFPTTINPIIQNKLIPVFVDIEPGTYNINCAQIEEAVTRKTKAIIVAHTLGNPFNIDEIMLLAAKYNLWVIEDNCDALGSRYGGKYTGTYGHLATLSFYPAHHITTGEGGAIIINDPLLLKTVVSLRDWGRDCWCDPGKDNTCGKRFDKVYGNLPAGYDHKYVYSHIGYNLKMTDWQAAIGLSQLKKLPGFIYKRQRNFERLYKGLREFNEYLLLPEKEKNSEPSWFGFLISVKQNKLFSKNELVRWLDSGNIGVRNLFAGN
ncbi:MAG: lipopolysaccharide biosynthesis protein RfbH, partial [Syntrophothermus sp.]